MRTYQGHWLEIFLIVGIVGIILWYFMFFNKKTIKLFERLAKKE